MFPIVNTRVIKYHAALKYSGIAKTTTSLQWGQTTLLVLAFNILNNELTIELDVLLHVYVYLNE